MIFRLTLFGLLILTVIILFSYTVFCERREEISRKKHEERMKQQVSFEEWCEEADKKSAVKISDFYGLKSQ